MIKIWGRVTSINVQKVLLCAETLSIPYERQDAGLEFGVVDTPAYRALNPNGLVPTIEEDGFSLWESNSIVRYLCAKFGPRLDLRRQADGERWMDWQLTTLGPPVGVLFWGLVRSPGSRTSEEIAAARAKAASSMAMLDGLLAKRPWVAGEAIGPADFALGPYVHRWLHIPAERPPVEHLDRYYRRLMERPEARTILTLPLK